MNEGDLSVLNVGKGDIRVTFNQLDDVERRKAVKMLEDMQQRGYLIAVELPDGSYTRAVAIDGSHGRYIITLPASMVDDPPETEPVTCACGCGSPVKPGKRFKHGHSSRKPGSRRVSVPMGKAKAVGVARSAGG